MRVLAISRDRSEVSPNVYASKFTSLSQKMSFKREEGVIKYQNIVHVEREKPLLKTNTKKMDEHISKELS